MEEKTTRMAVYAKDRDRLWELRRPRKVVPKKKPGRGRPPAEKETLADVFKRAVDALEEDKE